jgi:ribosomal RNA-processing protein 9
MEKVVGQFKQHRDSISSLKFRKQSTELYSASFDTMLKCYNCADLTYTETLFGHQDKIMMLDTHINGSQKALTCGARDRSCRVFKILEETQLVFGGTAKFESSDFVLEEMGI